MSYTLHLGDCLDVMATLADGSIDAVVTDPPYGISYKSGPNSSTSISSTRKRFTRSIRGDDRPFDPAPLFRFPVVAMFGAQHYYDRLPPGGTFHAWDKRGDYKPLDFSDFDTVWINRRMPARCIRHVWRGICRQSENNQPYLHPTQKPIAVMEWVMGLLGLEPGMTVLDPYMGSGTTGVTCQRLGLKFIGIESDPEYFAIAERRLSEASKVSASA